MRKSPDHASARKPMDPLMHYGVPWEHNFTSDEQQLIEHLQSVRRDLQEIRPGLQAMRTNLEEQSYATFMLHNATRPDLAPIAVKAVAEMKAMHLQLPQQVAKCLELVTLCQREAPVANGTWHLISFVGPSCRRFGNRSCFLNAIVFGGEVVIGEIPLSYLDLVIHPVTGEVTVHPERPNFAGAIAK